MRNKLQKQTLIIFAVMLGLTIYSPVMSAYAAATPGTRVVKATLPAEKKADAKKPAAKDASEGKAGVSEYSVPGIDSTVQEKAARTWFLGILGGDREYSASAPALFKTPEENVSENDAIRFIVLRESLYTASSWAMGMARIESMQKGTAGMDAEIYLPDTEPLITEAAGSIGEKFRIEPSTARIIAEWKISSEISSGERAKDIKYTTVKKTAPVNAFGVLALGPNVLKELIASPAAEAIKAVEAVRKHKIAYAMPYVDNIAFIVRYSSSLDFPPELRKALE